MAASSAVQFFNDLNPKNNQDLNITPSGKIVNNKDGLPPPKSPRKRSKSSGAIKKKSSGKIPGNAPSTRISSEKSGTESASEGLTDATDAKSTKSRRTRSRKLAKAKKSASVKVVQETSLPASFVTDILKPASKSASRSASRSASKSTSKSASKSVSKQINKVAESPHPKTPAPKTIQKRSKSNPAPVEASKSGTKERSSSVKLRSQTSSRSVGLNKAKKSQMKTKLNRLASKKVSKLGKVGADRKKKMGKTTAENITSANQSQNRNSRSQSEPPFYASITPAFFSKLKAIANESNANNIESKKADPVKMETLTAMLNAEAKALEARTHAQGRNPKKKRSSKQGKTSVLTFDQARDALSLGHVPLEKNPLKIGDALKTKPDPEVITSWKSLKKNHDSNTTSVGVASLGALSNRSILSGTGCNASALNIKKKLRFDEKGTKAEVTNSSSNNTRRLSSNLIGGCLK